MLTLLNLRICLLQWPLRATVKLRPRKMTLIALWWDMRRARILILNDNLLVHSYIDSTLADEKLGVAVINNCHLFDSWCLYLYELLFDRGVDYDLRLMVIVLNVLNLPSCRQLFRC